jgi:hypothetical protein
LGREVVGLKRTGTCSSSSSSSGSRQGLAFTSHYLFGVLDGWQQVSGLQKALAVAIAPQRCLL